LDGIVIFANRSRGVAVARALTQAGHAVLAITGPQSRLAALDIANVARALGTRYLPAPDDINDPAFLDELRKLKPRLGIIAGYPQIFRAPLRESMPQGILNLHPGPLPGYRGGSPLNWQILNGETAATCSIIRIDDGIDTGPVLAEASVPIGATDTIAHLQERTDAVFGDLVAALVARLEKNDVDARVQDERAARYWHQRSDADGRILWAAMTARQVHDLVRAVTRPYPGAFAFREQRKLRVYSSQVPQEEIRGSPGRVQWLGKRGPYVICKDRALLLGDWSFADGMLDRLRSGEYLS
jgi:methionyl-tRNA formyltransferase